MSGRSKRMFVFTSWSNLGTVSLAPSSNSPLIRTTWGRWKRKTVDHIRPGPDLHTRKTGLSHNYIRRWQESPVDWLCWNGLVSGGAFPLNIPLSKSLKALFEMHLLRKTLIKLLFLFNSPVLFHQLIIYQRTLGGEEESKWKNKHKFIT